MDYEKIMQLVAADCRDASDCKPFEDACAVLTQYLAVDKRRERAWALKVREIAERKVMEFASAGNGELADELYRHIEYILRVNAPHDLDSYMLFMEWNREPEKRFWLPRRHVLMPVCEGFQALADDEIDILIVSLPPRVGKALANDTPVMTDVGWKHHGNLSVGDKVVSPNGKYVDVLAVHPQCKMEYEVEFTNGESIVCHGNHEWNVYDRHRQKTRNVSTKELYESEIESGENGKRGHRYHYLIPNREPMEGVDKILPVDPYTLGAWLGDGRRSNPDICGDRKDAAIIERIVDNGHPISWRATHKTTGVEYYGFKSLRAPLQTFGMCKSREYGPKYIPNEYITASKMQRLELLAGLVDTDGSVSRSENRIHFTTADEELKDTFVDLVSTFGWRCSVQRHDPTGVRSSGGILQKRPYWCVSFNPTESIPCSLERKRMRSFSKQRRVAVKSVKKIDGDVYGSCITVEGGMYCAGKTMIPTHNSTTGIFAMTWNMGRNPDDANVMSGYGDKLTVGFHSEALDLITGDDYRFHEVFPTSNLKDKSMAAETIDLHRKKRFPSLTCRSVGGGTTGAVEIGSKGWLYCDDMVKDREESLSADRMDKLYAAYLAQLADRKKDGAKEVHVGTRWVPNDVIGRVIDLYDGDDRVRIINIPALNENGESNFNYLYGVGFTTEYYDDMRRRLVAAGEDDEWCAKYMCEPYWKHGQMFPPEELRYYDDLPDGEPDAVIAVCDTKGKGGDYCVQPVGYVYGDRHYIHDVICDNSLPEKHKPRLVDCLVKNEVSLCRYESNVAGSEIAYQVEGKCRERGLPLRIETKYSTENKETRILADAGWVKERCLFRATPPNPDYRKFMDMLTRYTVEGKNAHDDAPDAMSMYKRFTCGMAKAVATPMARLI